ncbi:MAG: beta-propeller repeat protein [Solirubrobacterales bacterium]|nr:beta-propeller repeat protein [Solirubrobacterales bacterium]
MRIRQLVVAGAGTLAVSGGALAIAQLSNDEGRIGPDRQLLNNGRRLQPLGKLVQVGGFPTGGALTPNGRYYWAVSTGRGIHDVRIISVRSGRVLQTLRLPGASGGIAMDPVSPKVYVSGIKDSSHAGQKAPDSIPGRAGDVIHVFSYSTKSGSAAREGVIAVPPPANAPTPQNFPPTNLGQRIAWPDRLAVAPDGKRLLVPLNLADSAAIVDVATKGVRYVPTGNYPYGAAILRDGRTGLVSNETPGTVSVVNLDTGKKVKDITVGAHLSHPEAIAVDPKADRAYVAVANSDQVAVIDTRTLTVQRTLSVGREEGLGTSPVDLTVTPDGRRLLVAEAGADEIAVFALPAAAGGRARPAAARAAGEAVLTREIGRAQQRVAAEPEAEGAGAAAKLRRADEAFALIGRIPTAQYPTDVEVTAAGANPCGLRAGKRRTKKAKRCARLLYLSGKGLGTGPNPDGPQPDSPKDSDGRINETGYLPLLNLGMVGLADLPTTKALKTLTRTADRQLRPTNAQTAPSDTPLKPGGPIKHVFYIVRENRTYDQILGDEPRGDGDPKLALFGGDTTPNAHALAKRFPLLDHVYANSEASIDGHFWASAAKVSDYVNKNWFQNYGGRGRPYDFGVYAVTWPGNGFLFDQAERQGISYFNYGEAIAGAIGLFPDKDRTGADSDATNKKFLKSDLGVGGCYPNDASIGYDAITMNQVWDTVAPTGAQPLAASRTSCFQTRFAVQEATNSVPAFNYLVLTNDHTNVLNGGSVAQPNRTPRAMIADNDEAVGRIVDTISRSKIWKSSAIFVIEDDSQDGADHVDAHRIPAFVISPYAKKEAVVHTRYDFLSVIRSMELILGMKPLGLFDELAVPMYDAFGGTPANAAPVPYVPAKRDLLEYNPRTGPGARASARLPKCLDCIGQRDMDRLLWKSVHGLRSEPPPPGPNAEGIDAVHLHPSRPGG